MNKEIQNILNDLYAIDFNFKKFEPELIKIINELTALKPETLFDETFKQELKIKLISRAQELSSQKKRFNLTKKLYYFYGALALIILLVMPGYYLLKPNTTTIMFNQSIEQLDERAFGSLLAINDQAPQVLGFGGGGGMAKTENSSIDVNQIRSQSGGGMGIPNPDWISYKYIYSGENLEIPANTMTVYKKNRGLSDNINFSFFLKQFNFDNLDLAQFSNAKVKSLNLAEEIPFGLEAQINFDEGSISLNANYFMWPNPYENCRDENCYNQNVLKIEQVPSDNELIQIAKQFIQKYNISLQDYGEPFVNNLWKEEQTFVSDNNYAYIPEEISVIFPEMLNNQSIYDSGGNKQGINIGINIRNKKVSGLYNLTAKNFQSSNYSTASLETILNSAKQGGLNGLYYNESNNIIEITLGTPELALIKTWQQEPNKNYSNEIIAPAYIFPIINPPEGFDYWRKNIIVPLIEDLVPSYLKPTPVPMPLTDPMIDKEIKTIEAELKLK